MLLTDVGEGELYKPLCQQKKIDKVCSAGWQNPSEKSEYCYNFLESECAEGCDFDDAGEVCEDNGGLLAEGPDFEFLTNFAKLLKLKVNWRLGITYNQTTRKFIRESDGAEIVFSKNLINDDIQRIDTKSEVDDEFWNPDFKYEYDYELTLLDDRFDIDDPVEATCTELNSDFGWKIQKGKCKSRQSRELNVQPLCELK